MIYQSEKCLFALCEDHLVYWWRNLKPNPQLLTNIEINQLSSRFLCSTHTMLTYDNRVLVGYCGWEGPCKCIPDNCPLVKCVDDHIDITPLIYSVLDPGCTNPIIEICLCHSKSLIVMTTKDIIRVNIKSSYKSKESEAIFSFGADYISSYNHYLLYEHANTTNVLFATNNSTYLIGNDSLYPRKPGDLANIKYSVKVDVNSFDLTIVGTVNMYNCRGVKQLEFYTDTFITRMVQYWNYVIFVSDVGECWYLDGSEDFPVPILLTWLAQSVPNQYIDDIILPERYSAFIIFQRATCDRGQKICDLIYVYYDSLKKLAGFEDPNQFILPIKVPYTCGTVRMLSWGFSVFFVSEQGQVYVREPSPWGIDAGAEPMPFFLTNPVAVPRDRQVIRSASNTVDH